MSSLPLLRRALSLLPTLQQLPTPSHPLHTPCSRPTPFVLITLALLQVQRLPSLPSSVTGAGLPGLSGLWLGSANDRHQQEVSERGGPGLIATPSHQVGLGPQSSAWGHLSPASPPLPLLAVARSLAPQRPRAQPHPYRWLFT